MLRTAIAFSLTFAFVPAHAEIFKCIDPAGKVEYRNSACPSGTQSAALELPVVTAGRTLEIRRSSDDRDLRRDADSKEIERPAVTPRARPSEPVNALPPPQAEKQK
jgi:hypothetical protein